MTLQAHSQMIITVLLANHTDRQHTYDFHPDDSLASVLEIVGATISGIANAINDQRSLLLMNPLTGYAPQHIIGFQVTTQGHPEIEDQVERISHLGFTT